MKNKGYSLVEVLLALTIISIAILPILSMQATNLKMDSKSLLNSEVARLSMTIADYIKSKPYSFFTTDSTGIVASNGKTYTLLGDKASGYTMTGFATDFGFTDPTMVVINSNAANVSGLTVQVILEKTHLMRDYGTGNIADDKREYSVYDYNINDGSTHITIDDIIRGKIIIKKDGTELTNVQLVKYPS